MKKGFLLLIIVTFIFLGCSKKSNLKDENSTIDKNKTNITIKRDKIINTILTNAINDLDTLEKEIDKALFVVKELDSNLSIGEKNYETKSLEYQKKIETLLNTIYKFYNKNIELTQKEENLTKDEKRVKSDIDKKFKKLLKRYQKLLKNSKRYKFNMKKYKNRLDKLLLKMEQEKREEKAVKEMFNEIEIKGE